MSNIKRIGVLTSGGDAPGMNAAIRAVTRAAIYHGLEVYGIMRGYEGMMNGDFTKLESKDVSGIIQKGGTILETARCLKFKTEEGRRTAFEQLQKHEIDGVVVIGGDGSFTGASLISKEHSIPFIGIPGTIDNDLYGTDYTIGYDTALNTVVEAVDKIRDTASSHNRIFFVEVMGKEAGFVALRSGIACGAEAIFIPEVSGQQQKLINYLTSRGKKKKSSIIMVAEGDDEGNAFEIAKRVQTELPETDIRVTILGHIQRGGTPSAYDRVTASKMGVAAVEALLDDQKSIMIGLVNNEITHVPLSKTVKLHKDVSQSLLELADILV
ncbi:MAG TPA: 6-phosphofructokinase [Bacteroidales bacterium]|nr:6-phosphofructokinase [Bacteroidales bacterium]